MPAPFPLRYRATVTRTRSSSASVEAPPRAPLAGDPAAELEDDATRSSEHLLLSSIGLGLLTTFEALAARDGLDVRAGHATIQACVDRAPEGPAFRSIVVGLELELAGDVERVEATLADARRCCPVLGALRVPVVIETSVRAPDARDEPARRAG